jgi:hypothetical protein
MDLNLDLVYRYGESEGFPSQSGITKDAQVLCFLHLVLFLSLWFCLIFLTALYFNRPHLII